MKFIHLTDPHMTASGALFDIDLEARLSAADWCIAPDRGFSDYRAMAQAEAARDSPEPVLLIGDLNVTMFSPHYEQIEDAGMTNARAGRGVQPTWPDWSPVRIPIDHVLVSDEFEVCEMEVLDSFGSDHLPVLATVRMD